MALDFTNNQYQISLVFEFNYFYWKSRRLAEQKQYVWHNAGKQCDPQIKTKINISKLVCYRSDAINITLILLQFVYDVMVCLQGSDKRHKLYDFDW